MLRARRLKSGSGNSEADRRKVQRAGSDPRLFDVPKEAPEKAREDNDEDDGCASNQFPVEPGKVSARFPPHGIMFPFIFQMVKSLILLATYGKGLAHAIFPL
jgi:hypothetical protein